MLKLVTDLAARIGDDGKLQAIAEEHWYTAIEFELLSPLDGHELETRIMDIVVSDPGFKIPTMRLADPL